VYLAVRIQSWERVVIAADVQKFGEDQRTSRNDYGEAIGRRGGIALTHTRSGLDALEIRITIFSHRKIDGLW